MLMARQLILIHGALGSSDQMMPLTAHLAANTLIIDLPGHGDLSHDASPLSIKQCADRLAEKIEAPVDIFGYSMGGYVALYLAAHYPEKVGKVITLATKFAWTPEGSAQEVRMLDENKIREKVPAFAALLEQRHGVHWPDVLQRTAAMLLSLGNAPALTAEVLNRVKAPVLLLRGDSDVMVSDEETVWAATHIPNAKMKSLAGQPHPFEKTDMMVLSKEIEEFLK
jgi:pimeloyl-ACP methyl ester carboxylesterase